MPVVVVFECEICGGRPDPETQLSLERQLLDLRHGENRIAVDHIFEDVEMALRHGRGLAFIRGKLAGMREAR